MAMSRRIVCWIFALAMLAPAVAAADPVENFYRGKTISLVIGLSPGGDYDQRARLLARYLGEHIPGRPVIIPRNMPGGGGLVAANWLANIAPRDGTVLLMITQNLPVAQALSAKGVEFDVRLFNWIGNSTDSPSVISAWHTTGIKTIYDAMDRELVLGASGRGAGSYYYPLAMNALIGTKFKVVSGFPGGAEMNAAMESGKIGGRANSWTSWLSTRPDLVEQKKIHFLVQIGLERHPDLKDVPLMHELAKNEDDAKLLLFFSSDSSISRAIVTTPGTSPEKVKALRRAFDATVRDPEFLAEAKRAKIDISPSSGETAQAIAAAIIDTPSDIVTRAKKIIAGKGK